MAIDIMAAFANGVSACYDPSQVQALFDAYCNPCVTEGGVAGGCFKLLPSGTPISQFPLLGWGNQQPDPAECPFLAVVVDCTLYLAPNDPSCDFTNPAIWVKIGGFISAPKGQFSYQSLTAVPMTPDGAWYQLPLGVQDFNTMPANLTAVGNTVLLTPGSYIIQSQTSFNVTQAATELFLYTRLFDVTHGVQIKLSNFGRISGLSGSGGLARVNQSLNFYLRARVVLSGITTFQVEHWTSGADPGDFKIIAGNNELYIERDS